MKRRAFTLVELLIALTLLMALVAMATGVFRDQIDEAKYTVREANIRAIRRAIQAFYNDHGRFPYNGQDELGNVVMFLDNNTSELVKGVHDGAGTYPPNPTRYLREIPVDPMTGKADWILVPFDNDGDWKSGAPSSGGDDADGDGRPSIMPNGLPEPRVDEDGFGGDPQDQDKDGKVDEDPPDVRDVQSRVQ